VHKVRRAIGLVAVAVLSACPDRPLPYVDENDPLLKKLKTEQERLDQGGAPGGPQPLRELPSPLADVAQRPPDMPIPLPVNAEPQTIGEASVTPKRLETAQILGGSKVKLSTTERFVRLVISVTTSKMTTFDLAKATLRHGSDGYELARDVQRVGQGSPLSTSISPGVAQDVVLYFESPLSAIAPPLKLMLPTTSAMLEVQILSH
jgi:hypothetical protein